MSVFFKGMSIQDKITAPCNKAITASGILKLIGRWNLVSPNAIPLEWQGIFPKQINFNPFMPSAQ